MDTIPKDYFAAETADHLEVAARCRDALAVPFAAMLRVWATSLKNGGKILFFGNGGSAADAQHLAAELVVRYRNDRTPIAGLALTTDTSVLTAVGNDMGFEQIFARQIQALGRPGDVAVGLSTSGRSPNVAAGLRAARGLGLDAAAMTGGDGGDLVELADPLLIVPSDNTARIQEMHILLGHMLCGALELEMGLV
ncbi:MAG: phosphoheptose isomerase [Gemmatimonas sp. SG8_38_2]|nr:MAG: phosphoheptose isomerase [Gemmatimonas sp. SG8_38_2]